MKNQIKGDLALLIITVIWGSTFVLVKQGIAEIPVYNFLAIRFGIAFFLLAIIYYKKLLKINWATFISSSIVGLALFLGYAFQTVGLQYTTASKSGFITGFTVVLVPLFQAFLLKNPPKRSVIAGVILAFIGLILLTTNIDLSINIGDIYTFFCAISFALQIVFVTKFGSKVDYETLTTIEVGLVALLSAIFSLFFENPVIPTQAITWTSILITSIFATSLAFAVQNKMQQLTTPTHTALIFSAEPVFAAVFDYILLGEIITGRSLIGSLLILSGMLLAEFPNLTPKPSKNSN